MMSEEIAKKQLFWVNSDVKLIPLRLGHNNSWLDTRIFLEEKLTKVRVVFKLSNTTQMSTKWCNVFARAPTNNDWFTFEFEHSGSHPAYFNIGSTTYCGRSTNHLPSPQQEDITLIVNSSNHSWSVNGTWETSGTYTGNIGQQVNTLKLGIRGSTSEMIDMAVELFEVAQDDTLLGQFIATQDSAGNACFYDSITKSHFYSAGTGAFESVT